MSNNSPLNPKTVDERRLNELRNCLRYWGISFNEDLARRVSDLTLHEFTCLEKLLRQLVISRLLSEESFTEVLRRASAKEEKILPSQMKLGDKTPRYNLFIDGRLSIFSEPKDKKQYLQGNYGSVEKAYSDSESMTATFAIKKYLPNDTIPSRSQAMREVKYHRMLGRQAFFSASGNQSVLITDWLPGKALSLFSRDELLSIPRLERLRALVTAFKELDFLHRKLRVHGDIKEANLIFDPEGTELRITDFGSCRKIYSRKGVFMSTREFWAAGTCSSFEYTLCDDIYAFGFIVAKLFPEICCIELNDTLDASVVFLPGSTDVIGLAVTALINNMLNGNAVERCSSLDAYHYCHRLIEFGEGLTAEQLLVLQENTICRQTVCEEDAYRGATKGGCLRLS